MSTKQLEKFETTVDVPEGVTVTLNKHMLQVQGPLGKTYKNFKKIVFLNYSCIISTSFTPSRTPSKIVFFSSSKFV